MTRKECVIDWNSFQEELKMLLALVRADTEVLDSIKKEQLNIDWNYFIQLSIHHRVFPIVYLNAKNLCHDWFPQKVLHTLQVEYMRNTFQMLHFSSEMEQVCKTLGDNGIRILILKGPVLAKAIYGDLSLRTSKDLDFLISTDTIKETNSVLLQLGYVVDKEHLNNLQEMKRKTHHLSYFHPNKNIQIEVHWSLNPGSGKESTFDELWKHKQSIKIATHSVYYLGNEDLFLYLVSHGARHGWFRIRWLVDIDRMLRNDCVDIQKLGINRDCEHIVGQALILSSQLLQSPTPNKLRYLTLTGRSERLAMAALMIIKELVIICPLPPTSHDVNEHYQGYLFSTMSNRQRWNYLINKFYPSPLDIQTLVLPRPLYFLYFPLRPLLWLIRQIKPQSSLTRENHNS